MLDGMGFIVLYLGYFFKIFKMLMGISCDLKWCEVDEKECLWVVELSYLIVEGIGEFIEFECEEMYGEYFDILVFDELIFMSWFEGGEIFRSGCMYKCGNGKVFYFRFGYEIYLIYYNKDI